MKNIIASLLVAAGATLGGHASATAILHLNDGSQANAGTNLSHIVSNNLITASEADTYATLSNAAFNALTPAQLRSAYDVIVAPWYVNTSANLDWSTRLLPYLSLGGSILWEDPDNIGELVGSGLTLTSGNTYTAPASSIVLTSPFGDLGAEGFYHIHFSITGTDGTWNAFSTDANGGIHGVNKEFAGGGRMVVGVSDNLYHPNFTNPLDADHMRLTINELNWLASGSITGEPGGDVPEPGTLALLGAALFGLAAVRRRQSA